MPVHDDRRLFEMLILEGARRGCRWSTILRKREAYRRAFDGFDPGAVARYGARDVRRLLADPGIVRNRLKVEAAIDNARASWQLRERRQLRRLPLAVRRRRARSEPLAALGQMPAETEESRAMSKALRSAGFRFVGPTICYAFMQAVGMVNDHRRLLPPPRGRRPRPGLRVPPPGYSQRKRRMSASSVGDDRRDDPPEEEVAVAPVHLGEVHRSSSRRPR